MGRFLPGFLCFWLWASLAAHAQDSLGVARLRQSLPALPPDTGRVRVLSQLCYALHDHTPTQAVRYGEEAVRLARRLEDKPGLMRALLHLGSCYANLSDGPHALKLQQEALLLAQELQNTDGIVRGYTAMGSIHHERGDTINAWANYRQALTRVRTPGVSVRTQLMLYGNLGGLFFYEGQYPKGMQYTRYATQLARRSGDRAGEAMYLGHLGTHYLQIGNYGIAEGLLRKALELSEAANNPRFVTSQQELLATVLLLTNKLDEAEELTRKALAQGRRIGFLERVLDGYDLMANIQAARQQYRQAYEWRQRYEALNDTLNSRARLGTLSALQSRYETAEKENQIRLLTQRTELQQLRNRELRIAVGALVLGLVGAGGLTWQLRRSKRALAANHAALERANAQTQQLASSKDRLYSIVAHDLRGPVTSFVGVTELIDFYLRTGDEQGLRRLPEQVRQSAQHLNSLLDNLLNWAVTQTGELAFQPQQLQLGELLRDVEALHRPAAQARQIGLSVAAAEGLTAWADANMTRTILRNLVSNALKCTPVGGSIRLGAVLTPDDRMVAISVWDTGFGMPEEQVQALLDPGRTPPRPAVGRARSGTGLGLPLCLAFVRRQGGELHIKSTPGQGTTVQFTLPRTHV